METPKIVVFVVKRYAVREAEKWRYAVRKAKIGRYAVRKGGGGCHPHLLKQKYHCTNIRLVVKWEVNYNFLKPHTLYRIS